MAFGRSFFRIPESVDNGIALYDGITVDLHADCIPILYIQTSIDIESGSISAVGHKGKNCTGRYTATAHSVKGTAGAGYIVIGNRDILKNDFISGRFVQIFHNKAADSRVVVIRHAVDQGGGSLR